VLIWVALLAACAPVSVECAARIVSRWTPVGDDAMVAFLSYDVLSGHSPTHGMPSTLAPFGTRVLYHPGPLLFWVFAIPERATGGAAAAIVLTVGALQVASIVAVALLVLRRAGSGAALLALAALSLCELALGRDVLGSPLNTYSVLLPFAAFLVSCWVVACGDGLGVPIAALLGSLAAQSHFVFLPVVASVGTVSVVAYVLERLRRRERNAGFSLLSRFGWAGVIVLVVCWLPVVCNTIASFPGNLLRAVRSGGSEGGATIGTAAAARAVVHVLAQYRLWPDAVAHRPEALYAHTDLGELVLAGAGIAAVIVAARQHPSIRRPAVVVFVAVAAAGWTLSRLPPNPASTFGPLFPAGDRDRFVYVIGALYGALVALSVGATLTVIWPRIRPRLASMYARVALVSVVACLAIAGSARNGTTDTLFRDPAFTAAIRDLGAQHGALDRHRTYVVKSPLVTLGLERGVVWELYRRGYDVRVPAGDQYLSERHGPPHGPVDQLWVVDANAPRLPSWILVARTRAAERAFDRDLASLRVRIRRAGGASWLRAVDGGTGRGLDVGRTLLAHHDLLAFAGCSTTLDLIVRGNVDRHESMASLLCTFEEKRALLPTATISVYLEPKQ
jgi:hypothetical protein